MGTKLLLFCGLIPSILSQCTVDRAKPPFRRAVYDFSIDLLTRIAQEKESHFIASTLSPWTLLSCISLGAEDTTLAELRDVLRLQTHSCFNNKYLDIVNSISSKSATDVIVERSSIIFSDINLPVKNSFKNTLKRKRVSDFEMIPFTDADAAAQTINNYVSQATHDAIEEIVSPGDLEDIVLVMIDAIFFKGAWKTPFVPRQTLQSPFYNERGVQTGDVNLMLVTSQFNYKAVGIIQAHVLELPYGSDGRYAALFMLPHQGVPLTTVIENLKSITLTTIYKLFESEEMPLVTVEIPRFRISSDLNNLKELLMDMGLKTMFSDQARFPKISDRDLSVSNFVQKAEIEVTEEGTTASAATEAGFSFRSFPEKFTANRPFLYMIIDKELEVPLFTGAYSKPSVY